MLKKASPALFTLLCLFSTVFQLSAPVAAHDDRNGLHQGAVDRHKETDFGFPGFKELNAQLYKDFLNFDNSENLRIAEIAAANAGNSNSHILGSWSPSFSLPLVPIHVMVLINGKVLMWDSVGDNPTETYPVHNFTRAALWDPVTNIVTNVNNETVPNGGTGFNLFCAGFAHLPDGTAFLAGGNRNEFLDGIDETHYFNHITNTWSLGPVMAEGGRWYPSVTPLANGEMLITSGYQNTPEVYTTAATLRTLSNATYAMPLYPWLHAAPNGRAFNFGPNPPMNYFDTSGTGSRQALGNRDNINRTYGSFAMYDIGKIIASGGENSRSSAVKINILNPNVNPIVTPASPMAFGRRQHNLTVLPDGSVLATGGNHSQSELIDLNGNVFEAEIWSPVTQNWRTLSSAAKVRQYHSAAILLADGRVFTGGGGICGTCQQVGYLEKNMEIFTPPYLYLQDGSGNLAPRPTITTAPNAVDFDESFFVATPNATSITSVVMMRVSSVTHSIDFEQRRIPLKFSQTAGGLTIDAPPNSNIAPPGYYMLFLINNDGVPSEAKMMNLEFGSGLGAPLIVSSLGTGSSAATIQWVPVLGATGYTVKYGISPGVYTQSITTGNVTTLVVPGLTQWPYYFAVSASNGPATGGDSNEVQVFSPTAAQVSVGGRVTAPDGRGLSKVRVTLEGDGTIEARTVTTSSFGYYSFDNVTAGQSVVLSVSAKRYSFPNPTIIVQADGSVSDANFVSDPLE